MKRILKIGLILLILLLGTILGLSFLRKSKDIKKINELASQQDYIAFIEYIRKKKYISRRLTRELAELSEQGHPPVQLEYARILRESNPSEALKWTNIAHLGASIDASLCSDSTARSAPRGLMQGYPNLEKLILQSPENYILAMEDAFRWHESKSNRPHPGWVCAHGMSGDSSVVPEAQWGQIKDKAIKEYRSSFEITKNRITGDGT